MLDLGKHVIDTQIWQGPNSAEVHVWARCAAPVQQLQPYPALTTLWW